MICFSFVLKIINLTSLHRIELGQGQEVKLGEEIRGHCNGPVKIGGLLCG